MASSPRKTAFFSHRYLKTIILPRQARDKHRENSKKDAVFRTAGLRTVRVGTCVRTCNHSTTRQRSFFFPKPAGWLAGWLACVLTVSELVDFILRPSLMEALRALLHVATLACQVVLPALLLQGMYHPPGAHLTTLNRRTVELPPRALFLLQILGVLCVPRRPAQYKQTNRSCTCGIQLDRVRSPRRCWMLFCVLPACCWRELVAHVRTFPGSRGQPQSPAAGLPAPVNISVTACQIQTGWSPRSERSFER